MLVMYFGIIYRYPKLQFVMLETYSILSLHVFLGFFSLWQQKRTFLLLWCYIFCFANCVTVRMYINILLVKQNTMYGLFDNLYHFKFNLFLGTKSWGVQNPSPLPPPSSTKYIFRCRNHGYFHRTINWWPSV